MKNNLLVPPCAYQGGKQRLSKQIVDIMYKEHQIGANTKFYDICCGSGAISLELVNRGVNPENITMVDKGCFGAFWQALATDSFDLVVLKQEIDKLPSKEYIQQYLQELSNKEVDKKLMVYHYLLLQCGAFGSKQIWIESNQWKNNTFRSYWLPTETSNRRSAVNPMMPMPDTLYARLVSLYATLHNQINGFCVDALEFCQHLAQIACPNTVIYIDPPYLNTQKYGCSLDIHEVLCHLPHSAKVYVSEGRKLAGATETYLLADGRTKGNISGNVKKPLVTEYLNSF